MKILKIQANGLKPFDEKIEIDFYAKQRVSSDKNEMLTNVFSNIYINNVISMVGINASGKTTTLKFISFVLQMLQNEPINNITSNDVLEGLDKNDEVVLDVYFVSDDKKLIKLNTVIKNKYFKGELPQTAKNKYYISSETMWEKSLGSIRVKNDLFDFSNFKPITERNNEELFLLDDVSVIVALNKKQNSKLFFIDSVEWTDFNGLRLFGDFPIELIQFLDPSIEYLKCTDLVEDNKNIEMKLKFYNKKEITISSLKEVNKYLSSGTVKGINVFMTAIVALKKGGYIIVDELENHFNKEIVSTLLRFFMDSEINRFGAVLIFSTHYIELLDIFERNDSVYLTKNKNRISVENLSDILKRNDVKKSELFQSGYLENTTPSYDSYINLKRTLASLPKKRED